MNGNMKILQGQLSKYTNVMKGWQYRWFVLNPQTGVLSYFMLEERRTRVRGSVHLTGAMVAPSDEDSHTFSVSAAAGELYRLRAADAKERQHWVDRLRTVIEMHNRVQPEKGVSVVTSAESRDGLAPGCVAEAEQPLSVLSSLHDANRAIQDTAKQLMQLTQAIRQLPSHATEDASVTNTDSDLLLLRATSQASLQCLEHCYWTLQQRSAAAVAAHAKQARSASASMAVGKPEKDFLSDVADWFDTNFGTSKPPRRLSPSRSSIRAVPAAATSTDPPPPVQSPAAVDAAAVEVVACDNGEVPDDDAPSPRPPTPPDDLSTVLRRQLSALKLGCDLTRQLQLPASLGVLQSRSLLELLADFWSRPQLFGRIGEAVAPLDRFCGVLEWYLSGWALVSPRRNKPYNPVLGETFACSFPHGQDAIRVLAEQVSHHPPVSALYAVCGDVSVQATVGCRAPYVNTSMSTSLTGQASLLVASRSETHTFGFPTLHVRGLFGERWIELGGQVKFACAQSGYTALINFQLQPSGGDSQRHRVSGEVRGRGGDSVARISGHWDRLVCFQTERRSWSLQCDTPAPVVKWTRPAADQPTLSSRRVWAGLTTALRDGDWQRANQEKERVETDQRERAGTGHVPQHFYLHDQVWVYKQ